MWEKIKNTYKNLCEKHGALKVNIIIICIILVLCAIGGSSEESNKESSNNQPKVVVKKEKPNKKSKNINIGINQECIIDGFKINHTISTHKELMFLGRGWHGDKVNKWFAQGDYLVTELTATNITNKPKDNDLSLDDVKLVIGNAEYKENDDIKMEYSTDKEVFRNDEVNPGMNQIQKYCFDVPVGSFDSGQPIYIQFKCNDDIYKIQLK